MTNNQDGGKDGPGSLFAYEQPAQISGTWTKHVLATGYTPNPTILPSPGAHSRGSPGRASSFKAQTKSTGKPQILLSGDDAGTVSILSAVSEDRSSWKYEQMWVCNSTGTVGSPAIGDVDNDGLADVFIPNYSANRVDVYSFEDAPTPAPPSTQCTACLQKKDPVKLSPAYTWCYKDSQCYLVGNPTNPCSASECASAAPTSSCSCTSCNDPACH